jgi:hypothetical protein
MINGLYLVSIGSLLVGILFAVFSKSMEFAIAYVGSLIETSSGQ